jgi:hypothetical protein
MRAAGTFTRTVRAMRPKASVEQAKGFALAMTKMAFAGELDDVTDTVMSNWRLA